MPVQRGRERPLSINASRGEYPTIAITRRGQQVAAGKLEPAELGVQMPSAGKQVRRCKRK
ncbi:MAG: hypothetical protein E6J90_20775 [Deltaproteobacteria bacterium]|nr:MAG: hypothetical protein E6J90_20775 [Deltaproteobacteria bacterium]